MLVVYVVAEPDQKLDRSELLSLFQKSIREDLNPLFKVSDVVVVEGTRVEKLAATTDMEADESLNWFQRQLEEQGVLKALRRAGAEEGDTVIVGRVEFLYTLSPSEETARRLKAEQREGGLGD